MIIITDLVRPGPSRSKPNNTLSSIDKWMLLPLIRAMQYVVIAYDGKDEGALERRMNARAAHLDNAKKMKAEGKLITAGAMLNDAGTMIGSVMIVEFGDEQELNSWLRSDPYTAQKVWEQIEVKPFRVAGI